ncbi:MAG: Fur family transcriptional regulator [Dehalococcoidia bacterium]
MGCETETAIILRQSGHRMTPQRLLIVSAVRHAGGHVSAAEVLEQVRAVYPYVDLSTVYRTLSVLKRLRLIAETDMGSGDYSYEWVRQNRHHHLICRICDSVTSLEHHYLENLGAEILEDYGFQADLDHFAIFGVCAGCDQDEDQGNQG